MKFCTIKRDVTLYVNNKSIYLKEIKDKIVIDSEMKNAYNNAVSLNYKMSGNFPILSVGENNISWTGNVTKLEIQPNWRFL